jgi:hypothetical protein
MKPTTQEQLHIALTHTQIMFSILCDRINLCIRYKSRVKYQLFPYTELIYFSIAAGCFCEPQARKEIFIYKRKGPFSTQASPSELCGGIGGSETGYFAGASVFLLSTFYQYSCSRNL